MRRSHETPPQVGAIHIRNVNANYIVKDGFLETLSWALACPDQIPDPTVQHLVLPSFDPPQFPSNDRPGQFGPGLDDES